MVNSSHGEPDVIRSLLLLPRRICPSCRWRGRFVYEMFFYLLFAVALRWMREAHLPRVLAVWAPRRDWGGI